MKRKMKRRIRYRKKTKKCIVYNVFFCHSFLVLSLISGFPYIGGVGYIFEMRKKQFKPKVPLVLKPDSIIFSHILVCR